MGSEMCIRDRSPTPDCLNLSRNGPDCFYEDCRCRRCEPKHRSIFVTGFTMPGGRDKSAVAAILTDYFSQRFGMVDATFLHLRSSVGPVAFVR